MHVLVTGAAGFIGFHLAQRLLREGHSVVGLDNCNAYYDVQLKEDRLKQLTPHPAFRFVRADMADAPLVDALFAAEGFTHVVNLAAQAGVRYSLENPRSYIQSNLVGFGNILEGCRHHKVQHLIFASSSSVYGLNTTQPFSVHHNVDHPVSLYAATKKSGELMAHTYSHLYHLPCTGLRFFTVYGPWGRPDMALHLFTTAIMQGKPINVFNNGQMRRDFTYIDDIIEGVVRVMARPATANPHWNPAQPDPATSSAPWHIYNIGNNNTVALGDFISTLEHALGLSAQKNFLPMQPGDVEATYANIDDLSRDTGFSPATQLADGIEAFVRWYKDYYTL
ncbi:MAG: NAD-dependent epimerase [Desulfovibrionaceae bacterium]